jgi:hypothetical protein
VFLVQMTRGLKFLHVTRDGRDIAFSGNQSPVTKFYDVNYGLQPGAADDFAGAGEEHYAKGRHGYGDSMLFSWMITRSSEIQRHRCVITSYIITIVDPFLLLPGEPEARGIRLWSDWNVDMAVWATMHSGESDFGYLRIRAEDLVSEDAKYDTYKKVSVE